MATNILSIQSHTVYGYVGNNCVSLPLQLLGMNVSTLNTVHFSNHTGYTTFKGFRTSSEQFEQLVVGLRENDLLKKFAVLLVGYVGNESLLQEISKLARELHELHGENFVFQCDPVLGDNGKLYVPETLPKIYVNEVLNYAHIITPNEFELKAILQSMGEIYTTFEAAGRLVLQRFKQLKIIVQTSSDQHADDSNMLSTHCIIRENEKEILIKATYEKIEGYYTGTGDFFSSLFLGHYLLDKPTCQKDYSVIIERVLRTLLALVAETKAQKDTGLNVENELCIVSSQRFITSPESCTVEINLTGSIS